MRKLLVFILMFFAVLGFSEDDINEIVVESLEEFEQDFDQKNTDEEIKEIDLIEEDNEEIENSNKSDRRKYNSGDSVKPTFSVSIFYPFFMGSSVDRYVSLATDASITPNAVPFNASVNGGMDLHFHYSIYDYLIVSGGFSLSSCYNFIKNSSDKTESGVLFTTLNFRAGLGGIYPILNILQIMSGAELGFLFITSGSYLASLDINYKNLSAPSFLFEPYLGFDVEIQKGLAFSFRFDYSLAVSGKKNSLEKDDPSNSSYFTHYPSIFVGLGFQF